MKKSKITIRSPHHYVRDFWHRRSLAQRIFVVVIAVWLVLYVQAVAIAGWYINKHKNEPLSIGATFIADYARYYDLDAKETMLAIRDDLGVKRFRLVSYWKNIEPVNGQYDFSELDWQFDTVEEVGGTVSLAIGLRQPRWPECHFPKWAEGVKTSVWQSELAEYMSAVINRYKDRPSLVSYQLENEYFLTVFGECPKPEREQLQREFDLVKKIDSNTPVIMSLANNYFGVPTGQPRADQFGVSVYKRVWDQTITKRYFEYPFTTNYYAYRAGLTELLTGKSSMLHELQAEPWPPKDVGVKDAPIAEQNKSMDTERLRKRVEFGIKTGFRDIDLWGAEWWYWRKQKLQDPTLWFAAKSAIAEANAKTVADR